MSHLEFKKCPIVEFKGQRPHYREKATPWEMAMHIQVLHVYYISIGTLGMYYFDVFFIYGYTSRQLRKIVFPLR